ncbi:hypothetical protein JessAGP_005c [Caulobacter phage Jess A]|nr:hypothetical protein JessAGP_005c [Caulobacter phage Jess A]WCA46414.1 hypothetical protein [Caulobacter phage RapA]
MTQKIAALFVETDGAYFNLPGVEAFDIQRDAKTYDADWPAVAHPPCQRWGRFWHGSTRKPFQFKFGDDEGCFASALASIRRVGGVIEHPAYSGAWNAVDHPDKPGFGLPKPEAGKGWSAPDEFGGRSCYVEQCHWGHKARKATWLYAVGIDFNSFPLTAGRTRAVVPDWMIERYGEKKARKIGVVAMEGGKDKVKNRNATPLPFRDLLIDMALSVYARGLV